MKTKNFKEFVNESFGDSNDVYSHFFVNLLGLRDQAHVFHWQTDSYARHEAFGAFYETFIGLTDTLAEMIMGLKGRPMFGRDGANINLVDYSESGVSEFIESSYELFNGHLNEICDSEMAEEVFDQARMILAEVDKLKYLLTLR